MISVFLDTTNQYLFVAIQKNQQIIDKIQIWNHQKHTEKAVSIIDEMLASHDLNWFSVNNLYLSIGPGSYTGIRVGITIAKTWKTISDTLKVYVTNSLLLQTGANKAISVIDAKSNKYFIAVYENLQRLVHEQVVNASNLILIKKEWTKFQLIEDYHQVDLAKNFLQVKHLAKLVNDVDNLEPLYLKVLEFGKQK